MLVYEVKQFARWASSCHAFCRWIYTKHAHIQSIQLSSKSSSLPAVMGCLPWKVGIKEWVGQLRCFFHLCFLHPVHHRKRNFLRLPFIPSDYPQRLITSALPLRSRETQLFFYVGLPYNFFFFSSNLNWISNYLSQDDKSGTSVSHSGLHSAITLSIQPTELSKQKNFSFSLSFSKAPFSVTLQPFDLCPNGAGHLGAEVQRRVKSGCVYVQERVCVLTSCCLCVAHCLCSPRALRSHLLSEPLPLQYQLKRKKKKKVVFPFLSLQSPNPFVFAAAELTWASLTLKRLRE